MVRSCVATVKTRDISTAQCTIGQQKKFDRANMLGIPSILIELANLELELSTYGMLLEPNMVLIAGLTNIDKGQTYMEVFTEIMQFKAVVKTCTLPFAPKLTDLRHKLLQFRRNKTPRPSLMVRLNNYIECPWFHSWVKKCQRDL